MTTPAGDFSACALHEHSPELFAELLSDYSEIVQLAARGTIAGTERRVFGNLRSLARRAGTNDALPQDLIAIHLSALSGIVKTKPKPVVKACIRQSRLLLVKMIGELALYYRDRAMNRG